MLGWEADRVWDSTLMGAVVAGNVSPCNTEMIGWPLGGGLVAVATVPCSLP